MTRGGQSTCGTEVVYRIGVNRIERAGARAGPGDEPVMSKLVEFDPAEDGEVPEEYTEMRERGPIRGIGWRWPRA